MPYWAGVDFGPNLVFGHCEAWADADGYFRMMTATKVNSVGKGCFKPLIVNTQYARIYWTVN